MSKIDKNYVHNEIFVTENTGCEYSSVLEVGDYIPYFVHKRKSSKISIQNSAGKPNLFIVTDVCSKKLFKEYTKINIPTHVICKKSSYVHPHIIDNLDIYKLFPSGFILTTPNLKIHKIFNNIDIKGIKEEIGKIPSLNPPILIIPNVINSKFRDELIDYYNKSKKIVELKGSKNRRHVLPDSNITKRLDDKLSKSLFPELKKIYNIHITHRENYKICSYTDEDRGKFHAHRDSVYPYGHRRFAMSLILNDDYEGGGIIFPEYNNVPYKPEPCSAVIFPTSLYHQVLEITGGKRYVIISFLFGDEEAKYKKEFNSSQGKSNNIKRYEMTVCRDQRNMLIDDICPQSL